MFAAYDHQPSTGMSPGPLFAAASAVALPTLRAWGGTAATIFDRATALPQPRPVAHRGSQLALTFFGLTLGVGVAFVGKEALKAGRDAVKQHPDAAVLAGIGVVAALVCGGLWWLGTRP
jgi:hypothetical protein